MATIVDLAKAIKQKYPGTYDQLTDVQLGRAIKAKFPDEYAEFEDISETSKSKKVKPRGDNLVVKTLKGAERALNVLSDPATRNIYSPIAKQFANEEQQGKIEKIRGSKDVVFPSDAVFDPFLSEGANTALESIPITTMGAPIPLAGTAKSVLRMGVDTALDPLSWLSFGTETAAGKISRLLREADIGKIPIKLDSKLAKMIAKEMGATKPSAQLLKKARAKFGNPAKTISEQVTQGQRSLASLELPFTDKNIPLVTGKIPGKLLKPLSMARRGSIGSKIENSVRELFSVTSGNEEFDALSGKYRSLGEYRKSLTIEDQKLFDAKLNEISKQKGIPREELDKQISKTIEDFVPTTKKLSKQKYGEEGYKALEDYYHEQIINHKVALTNARAQLAKVSAKGGFTTDLEKLITRSEQKLVANQAELNKLRGEYKLPDTLDPEIKQAANEYREARAAQLIDEQFSNVDVVEALSNRGYLAHVLSPDAMKARLQHLRNLGELPPNLSKKAQSEFLTNSLRRQFVRINPTVVDAWKGTGFISPKTAKVLKGKNGLEYADKLLEAKKINSQQFADLVHTMSLEEVNNLSQSGKLQNLFGDYTGEIFHSDPVFSGGIRDLRGQASRTAAEFYNEMKVRELALPDNLAPANWVNVNPSELKGFKVAPEVARVLNRYHQIRLQPDALSSVIKTYDKFHSLSKLWTLVIFPKYHTKNIVGNFWNNWLAGVENPTRYLEASLVQNGKKISFRDPFGNIWNSKKILQSAKENGVVDKGWFGNDYQRTLEQELASGKFFTLSSRNRILRLGEKVGKSIENNARMAHYIDRLRKGDTAEFAAQSVKKFLFDYGALSDFEKSALNRTFFFYTWTRKNIPLQLQSLLTRPAKFNMPFRAKHEIEKNLEPPSKQEEKYLYDWMKENFPVRVRDNKKDKVSEYFLLGSWLPAADILKIAHAHDVALNMLAPLPKEVLQQITNQDFFTKRKISNEEEETGVFHLPGNIDFRVPSRVLHGMKLVRLLNEVDKMSSKEADLYSTIIGILTGQNYQFDTNQARYVNKLQIDTRMNNLKSMYKKVSRTKPLDRDELDRIRQLMQQTAREY